jgi:uncharacterized protein YfeS
MDTFYFDDPEEGLARETSHPFFLEHAKADFYYDCTDDFSPFGNDSGADTLANLEEWYRERRGRYTAVAFVRQQIEDWGLNLKYLDITEPAQFHAIDLHEQYLAGSIDQAVIATAFGQYKIAGKGDKTMSKMATEAFQRQRYLTEKAQVTQESPWDLATEYLERLGIMEADLARMIERQT